MGLVRKPVPVERLVKPAPALIAGEDTPRPVPSVRRRSEPDDQEPRARIAEPRNRPTPVDLIAEGALLVAGDSLAVPPQPRAPLARDHRQLDPCEGAHRGRDRRALGRLPPLTRWPDRIGTFGSRHAAPPRRGPDR